MHNNTAHAAPDADIVEKVEKLLNLAARAGTEGEAKAAFAAASKLMTKHGIEQHRITGRDNTERKRTAAEEMTKVSISTPKWASERPYHLYVRRIIRHCFYVSIIKVKDPYGKSPDYFMLGTKQDCVFAAYAFETLSTIMLKHLSAFLKRNNLPRTPRYFNGYFDGIATGFCQAWDEAQRAEMKAQNADAFAIVLVDKNDALDKWVRAQPGIRFVNDRRNPDAFARIEGIRDGRKISLHRPIVGADNTNNAKLN